jgi:hypothetical protein
MTQREKIAQAALSGTGTVTVADWFRNQADEVPASRSRSGKQEN